MGEWFTPPQIARARCLRVNKVLGWIGAGELAAVNHAARRGGRPRWRVSLQALEAFDLARSNRVMNPPTPKRDRAKRAAEAGVIEFF